MICDACLKPIPGGSEFKAMFLDGKTFQTAKAHFFLHPACAERFGKMLVRVNKNKLVIRKEEPRTYGSSLSMNSDYFSENPFPSCPHCQTEFGKNDILFVRDDLYTFFCPVCKTGSEFSRF